MRAVAWVVMILGAGLSWGCRTQAPATRVVAFKVNKAPRGAEMVRGACWTHSIAASGRADAWRCMVENQIHDPCFVIAGGPELLCGADPSRPEDGHAFVLALDKALVQAQPAGAGGSAPAASRWSAPPRPRRERPGGATQPWLVVLADGGRCRPFTGTRPVAADGKAATYACTPEGDGDNLIFGAVWEAAGGVWTAEMGRLADGSGGRPVAAGLRQVAIAAAWR